MTVEVIQEEVWQRVRNQCIGSLFWHDEEGWKARTEALMTILSTTTRVDATDGEREDYKLPCDVRLPPSTVIRAGCPLSTLKLAMEADYRPTHFEARQPAAEADEVGSKACENCGFLPNSAGQEGASNTDPALTNTNTERSHG